MSDDALREALIDFALWNGDGREDAEWAAETYLSECARDTMRPRFALPAPGTPQNPVNGVTHQCPEPGYAGRHTAVGAGAISPPYVCHGCRTWFVLPDSTRPLPPGEGRA